MSSWKRNQRWLVGAAIAASLGLVGCEDSPDPLDPLPANDLGVENYNLWQLLTGAQQFKRALKAFEENGHRPALEGETPLTIIAFTDAAFDALPKEDPKAKEPKVNEGRLSIANLANFSLIPGPARRTKDLVKQPQPPIVSAQPGATWELEETREACGAEDPTECERRYVANGVALLYGQDACGTNGCAFAVDGVVFPDNVFPGTVWDAVQAYPMFSVLKAAIGAYDKPTKAKIADAKKAEDTATVAALEKELIETLLKSDNEGNGFTLFAPRFNGWGKLVDDTGAITFGREDLDKLDDAGKAAFRVQLGEFIRYHLVSGEFDAAAVAGAGTLNTFATQGDLTAITVNVSGSDVTLNPDGDAATPDPSVTWTNLNTDNGFVHVVDQPLRKQ